MDEQTIISKTQRKRDSHALQELGEELTALQLLTSFIVHASQRIAGLRATAENVERPVSETSPGTKRQTLRNR